MNKKFLTDINTIRTAIDTNKLVVFAGAGISIDAGVPSWSTLIDELKTEIEIPTGENDSLRIAQMYYNERQQKEFIDKVRTLLKHKKVSYNAIHEAIFKLNPEHILTTNYDDLLEQVIRKNSLPFSVVTKDEEFPYALNTNLLVKIHGDLNNTDFVLKEDDYLDYSQNHPLIEAFLKSVFATKVVLFIGYSFSDVDLKMIMQSVRNILGEDFQYAYLLSVDENLHFAQRDYLKKKGINVISYFDALNDMKVNQIIEYLYGNNTLCEKYYIKGEKLSETGQKLLNFITFINTYDQFNETLTGKNIIDQVYLSLHRFSEFTSLPPKFVANLFPFKTLKNETDNQYKTSIRTLNPKLFEILLKTIENDGDEIRFKPHQDLKLTESEITEFEKRLKYIIRSLNLSLIYNLHSRAKNPDSFGNFGWSDESVWLYLKTSENNDDLVSNLNRLNYKKVFELIAVLKINDNSELKADLELAYINYKLGNFKTAFFQFEEIAKKSWISEKFFTYYIAKHNIKMLRNLLWWDFEGTSKAEIIREIEDIDFDKLMANIPFIGEIEYSLLKKISDSSVLVDASTKINDFHKYVTDVFNGYKIGTHQVFSPNYPSDIEYELYKLLTFYLNNYIILDEYSEFAKVCNKAIEAIIISYATDEAYSEKLKSFNTFFFSLVVDYGDTKNIKFITKVYNVSQLKFSEKDINSIIELVNNFLNSFYNENTFLGKSIVPEKLVYNHLNNYFFNNKCIKKFNNIFLLLSGITLSKDNSNNLVNNLINFLTVENFLAHDSMNYLCSFIFKNTHLFNELSIEQILKISLRKINVYSDCNFFSKSVSVDFNTFWAYV